MVFADPQPVTRPAAGLILCLVLAQYAAGGQPAAITIGDDRFSRAVELQKKGALKEAEAEYRSVLAENPDYAEAHANLGAVLMRLDRYDEAVRSYEKALELAPHLKPVLLNLGIAHYRRGEFEKALAAFHRFLEGSPGHLQATQLAALSLVELGRDEESLEYFERALAATPDEPALLYGLGLASLRLRKPMVTGIITTLAKVPGGLPASHLLRGQGLLMNHQYEKAIVELEAAARLDDTLPRLHYSLGLAYFKADRLQESRAALDSELRRNPRDVTTLWYLASIDEMEGKFDAARARLDRARKLDPRSPDVAYLLGRVALKQGKAAEALDLLQYAVGKDPLDTQKRYQLARAYQQLGRKEEAAKEFAEVQRIQAEQLEKDKALIIKQ